MKKQQSQATSKDTQSFIRPVPQIDFQKNVKFDTDSQWARHLYAPMVGSMAQIIFRDCTWIPVQDSLQTDEAMQNCEDLCRIIRSMGYVAWVGRTYEDNLVRSLNVVNAPLPTLWKLCATFGGPVIFYYEPQHDATLMTAWATDVDDDKKYVREDQELQYIDWDGDDFLSLISSLSTCTKRSDGWSMSDLPTLSREIESQLDRLKSDKAVAAQLALYEKAIEDGWNEFCTINAPLDLYNDAINNVGKLTDPIRLAIAKPINELIDDGLLEPDEPYFPAEKWEIDKKLNKITRSSLFREIVTREAHICPQLYLDYRPDMGRHMLVLCHKEYGYDGTSSIDDYSVTPLTPAEQKRGFLEIVKTFLQIEATFDFGGWPITYDCPPVPLPKKGEE